MFVAVVVVLLLVVSLPQFSKTSQRLQAEQVAFELAQLLRFAREQAITRGHVVVWVWNASARRARLEALDGTGQQVPIADRLAQSAVVPSDVTLRLTQDGAQTDAVKFFPDGTSQPTSLLVSSGATVYTVTVDVATSQVAVMTDATTESGAAAH